MKKREICNFLERVVGSTVLIYLAMIRPVYAYIDPSVATYLIQAVAGIIIAVGASLGIYFRKAKKKMYDKLNMDENKGKEVESDDIIIKTNTDADQ